jgi:hypothetical protein
MALILSILAGICGIGSLICFVIVVMKMFQHGDSNLGIISLVLILCFGIGGLVAYVIGWMKVGVYGIQNIMMAWTGCIIGGIVFNVLAAAFAPRG